MITARELGSIDIDLLEHVLLSLAVGLERGARRLRRGVEILDRVTTILANAVAEHETLDFTNRADIDSAVVVAATRGARRRDDASGVFILGGFRIRIFDDVLRQAMGSLFGTLLSDVATDSSQRFLLTLF